MTTQLLATGWRKYGWLTAGAVLGMFALHSEWSIPVAGWLFAICLMRFTRGTGVLAGFGCVFLSSAAATITFLAAANRLDAWPILAGCLAMSLILDLPLLADRLLFRRFNPFLGTLVFPVCRVAAEFLIAVVSPFGTIFGPLATTQSSSLPVLQLASVTGIYGISFLMAWLAPIANLALERRSFRTVTVVYAAVLGVVLLGGGVRLAAAPTADNLVRVAGISPSKAAKERQRQIDNFHTPELRPEQKPVLRKAFAIVNDDLFARTRVEADAGAKIVAWPEAGALVLHDDYADFLTKAGQLASEKHIYLDTGIAVVLDGQPDLRDLAVLVGPDGRVLSTFDKAHPVPGLENFPAGDGIVPVTATPYGRLANVVCYDADFPGTLRTRADIMFVPANDWNGIEHTHSENAVFRAVENGYTVFRQTSNGIAITVDPYGGQLGRTNYFSAPQQTMVAYVPMTGTWTVYGIVGDLFAWLCVAGMLVLTGVAVSRRV
ncbi:nitrilase-related carbon-nitrogen hydrolase [Fodinicola acaciae]|uniref:nitrilase-related carbon-nitrogen hydrolase n=1 Tax=Fodinicola acaciae TaxID=2681555 RepID=UPI0013D107BC|nr:nitrilase-related carbon-nitrogen hydrolase [Fodinicola acaciae]